MAKRSILIGEPVQGNINDQKGNTIDTFKGVVVGFTKTLRVRIKNDEGVIRNFHSDETWHLNVKPETIQ